MYQLIILSALGVSLMGCGTTGLNRANSFLESERETLISEGKSVDYVDGYVDGCSSGRRVAGSRVYQYQQDRDRFEIDKAYSSGWDKGYEVCRQIELDKAYEETQEAKEASMKLSEEERIRRRKEEVRTQGDENMKRMWDELKK